MFEAWLQAAAFFLDPVMLAAMIVATIIGLVVGILPGIGAMLGTALLLPIVYRLDATLAIGFLVAFHAVCAMGGCITAILVNVPGEGTSVATLVDGFPMTRKGEGGRALGASLTASMLGGLLPPLMSMGMIPLIVPIVLSFRRAELALLIIWGLACISSLTGKSVIKGVISACWGVLIGMVGYHGLTGIARFTFGLMPLLEGIGIVTVTLGLFGLSEMIGMITEEQDTISSVTVKPKMKDVLKGVGDVYRHKWLWFRCTLIGYIIGIIPGVGGETAIWLAYAHAKQTSKYPEKFGTGVVEGVIAPGSGVNAKEAGDLLTTMVLGVPGGAAMALFLGAFYAVGVIPGPKMLVDHLPLAFTLLIGIAVANVIGGLICLGTAPYLVRIAMVHIDFLFPLVLALIITSTYGMRSTMFDVVMVIAFGLLGCLMKRFGYSRPSFLLGFVLGGLFELYLFQALEFYGPTFFVASPACIILLVLIVLTFIYPNWEKIYRGSKGLFKGRPK